VSFDKQPSSGNAKALGTLVQSFENELSAACPPEYYHQIADELSRQPGADSADQLADILSLCPRGVVEAIPFMIETENLSPTVATVSFVAKEITYYIETTLERAKALALYEPRQRTGHKLRQL
jgi:hypothetical protein